LDRTETLQGLEIPGFAALFRFLIAHLRSVVSVVSGCNPELQAVFPPEKAVFDTVNAQITPITGP